MPLFPNFNSSLLPLGWKLQICIIILPLKCINVLGSIGQGLRLVIKKWRSQILSSSNGEFNEFVAPFLIVLRWPHAFGSTGSTGVTLIDTILCRPECSWGLHIGCRLECSWDEISMGHWEEFFVDMGLFSFQTRRHANIIA